MGTEEIGNCSVKIEFAGRRLGHSQFSKDYFKQKTLLGGRNKENKSKIMTFFMHFLSLKQ